MNFRPKHQGEHFKLMERGLLVTSDETKALGNLTGFRDPADLEWVMKAINDHKKYEEIVRVLEHIQHCGADRPAETLRNDIDYLLKLAGMLARGRCTRCGNRVKGCGHMDCPKNGMEG